MSNIARLKTRYNQASGCTTIHHAKPSIGEFHDAIVPLILSRTQGLTNCRGGEISAKTNLHNTIINFDSDENHCAALSGNGNVTYYTVSHIQNLQEWRPKWQWWPPGRVEERHGECLDHYHPLYERKPNGNHYLFGGGIKATDPSKKKIFSSIAISRIKEDTLSVKASDGKTGVYQFTTYEHKYLGCRIIAPKLYYLKEASFSHKPRETYEYSHQPPSQATHVPDNPLITCIRLPVDRFQKIEYYEKGKNKVDGIGELNISRTRDFRIDRVKQLKAPVGKDNNPIITHRFIYQADKCYRPIKKKDKKFSGWTKVYDAYLRKTLYRYNADHRLTELKHYESNGDLYSQECYVWDDHYAYPSQLCMHALADFEGNVTEDSEDDTEDFEDDTEDSEDDIEDDTEDPEDDVTELEENPHPPSDAFINSIVDDICEVLDEQEQTNGTGQYIRPIINKLFPNNKKTSIARLIASLSRQKIKILQKGGGGNLIGKYLKNRQGEILYAQFFEYDKRGNITKETFYGNLTGKNPTPIELDLHQKPVDNRVDSYKKYFIYSDDTFHNLLTELEDNGKGMIYEYYPEKNLVTAKYVTDNGKIRLRQFFYYDDNSTLIKLIKDDGSKKGADCLSDVTERLVTYFHPRQTAPMGLPEKIEEKYVNLDDPNKPEILLNRVDCHYSREGHLLKQEHYNADQILRHTLEWEYDPHGNIIFEKNALGQILRKAYDENDNLIYEEGPYYENQPRTDIRKKHDYDYVNRLIKTEETHPNGKTFTTEHEYDYIGNRTSTINRYGEKNHFTYDDFNRLTHIQYPPVSNDEGETITPTIEKKYDEANRPISIKDACQHETKTLYNARGSPLSITYPDETTETFTYYLDGSLATKTAKNGTFTHYERDYLGRILQEDIQDASGHLLSSQTSEYKGLRMISQTDAEGCTTTFSYDHAGRLKEETCCDSQKTYQYDSLGRIATITSHYGPQDVSIVALDYDLLNRLVEERIEEGNDTILQQICYTYDEHGNRNQIILQKQAGESITFIEYNADKKPIKIETPEGEITLISYSEDHLNPLKQKVLKVTTTDALNRTTEEIHDALGRLSEVIKKDPNGMIIAQQRIYYDPMGRPTRTIDTVYSHGKPLRDSITTRHYHPNGQEDAVTEAFGTPLKKTTYTLFNAYGEKWKIIKPDSTELIHEYDPFGRLSTFSAGSISYSYHYNLRHQITQVKDKDILNTYTYDGKGRLELEMLANGLKMGYEYDPLDRLKKITFPDGSTVQYLYDAAHLKEVQRYRKGKLLYRHLYSQYDKSGDFLSATLINNHEINFTYDLAGRPKNTHTSFWSQWVEENGYDPVGRLVATTIQDSLGKTPYVFSYDDLDHLTKEQGHVSNTYQVDSIHNRLEKNLDSYNINVLNQIESRPDCQYKYDLNGDLVTKREGSETTHYDYDPLDRLISIENQTGKTTYQYDAFNRRVSKIHQGVTHRYLYQGQMEVGCADKKGQMQELRILGSGLESEMGSAIALELHGEIFAPIHDQQGHIACLIDSATGQAIETCRYTAFGEETIINSQGEIIPQPQTGNPWRYACKRHDPETGFIYFGIRYYDPEIGRWTTPDPAGSADGPNLYA